MALTPITIKCLEKLVMTHINSIILNSLDLLLFVYRPLDTALELLEGHIHQTAIINYSSAFKTIVPSKLVLKLRELGLALPPAIGLWTS